MPAQQGRGGGGRGKNNNNKANGGKTTTTGTLLDSLKEACPPHKLGDLEALVKTLKGDEAKIRQTIAEWWETDATTTETEEWNDVSKNNKAKTGRLVRGGGRGGRGRGRGDRTKRAYEKNEKPKKVVEPAADPPAETTAEAPAPRSPAIVEPPESVPQPTPSPAVPSPQVGKGATTPPQRNVWTTKGTAHLIRAEKPTPPPPIAPSNGKTPPPKETRPATPVEEEPAPSPPPEPVVTAPVEIAATQPMEVPTTTKVIEPPAWEEPPVRKPTVNMGRWDVSGDQDFEFGSFQEEVEPARPPPGLSMPPMPSNAVLVHELENKLVTEPPAAAPQAEMVSQYAAAPGYGASYSGNGYNNNNTATSSFSAAKPPGSYNVGTSTTAPAPSEVLPVPPQNHYSGPMYYQPHQMHLAGQHQPPYNFPGYAQLGYAFAPNYNYNGQAEDSKNNRNRNNQNYQQQYASAYMSNHGYDPRYEGYVPQQQGQQSSYAFDNDYSKKKRANLHSQFHGGPPNFLQQEHPQQQQQHEWTGWNSNAWQSGGGGGGK